MTEEQKKVRKFYKDFQGWKLDTIGTWLGAGFVVLLMLIVCTVPAQGMLIEMQEEAQNMVWFMILLFELGTSVIHFTTIREN